MESFWLKNISRGGGGGGLVGRGGLALLAISVLVISMTQINSGEAAEGNFTDGKLCRNGEEPTFNQGYKKYEDRVGKEEWLKTVNLLIKTNNKNCLSGCYYWEKFYECVCGRPPSTPGPGPGPEPKTTVKPGSPAKSNAVAVHGNGLIVMGVLATLFSTLIGIF